jgi:antitoxin MazE
VRSRVQRWGNSLAVRIPSALAREARLGERSEIDLWVDEGRIVVEPLSLAPVLDGLIAGVTPQNAHGDLEWRPVSRRRNGGEG